MENINVLSLFDGMSCGQQALERVGILVNKYYASEVDKHAIKVTQANYPNTVQLGDVRNINYTNVGIEVDLAPSHVRFIETDIQLLIGGSPCQSFSFAGKRKGMATKSNIEIITLEQYMELKYAGFEFEGQSYLFWEYVRILKEIRAVNPNVKFILENVLMAKKWRAIISNTLGVEPIEINSALVSAQNRERLYWTNIGHSFDGGLFGDYPKCHIALPKDRKLFLKDILEDYVDEKYYLSENMLEYFKNRAANFNNGKVNIRDVSGKATTLTAPMSSADISDNFVMGLLNDNGYLREKSDKSNCIDANYHKGIDKHAQRSMLMLQGGGKFRIRRLTPTECERLQTVKDGYTAHVSDTQRYRMLGNGWTVDVIVHILSYIK